VCGRFTVILFMCTRSSSVARVLQAICDDKISDGAAAPATSWSWNQLLAHRVSYEASFTFLKLLEF
jgi:hypothetical protein